MCLTFQMMTLKKYLTKIFEILFREYPLFGLSKCGISKNDHPSTAYDHTFLPATAAQKAHMSVCGWVCAYAYVQTYIRNLG